MRVRPREIPWTAIYTIVVIANLALAILAWVVIGNLMVESRRTSERALVALEISQIRTQVEHQSAVGSHIVHGFTAIIANEPEMSQQRFEALAKVFISGHPEVEAIFAAPDLVVRYGYPLDLTQSIIGMPYEDLVKRHSPDETASPAAGTVLVGPLTFSNGTSGFVDRSPVYITGPDGVQRLWGILSSVTLEDAFYDATGLSIASDYEVALRSLDASETPGPAFFGSASVFSANPVLSRINIPGGHWEMAAIPMGGWDSQFITDTKLMGGFALGGIIMVIIGLLITYLIQQRLQSDARLADAINSMEDGFAFYDAQDRLITCNDRYRSFYEISSDVFIPGNRFADILRAGIERGQYPEAKGREDAWFEERMRLHREGGGSFEQHLADGRWLKIAETRSPDGGSVGFRVDITALKHAQQEAERANRAKTDFLNVMSHELRTPLTVVLGFAKFVANSELLPSVKTLEEALEDPKIERAELHRRFEAVRAEFNGYACKIERAGQHLLSLINDMLDLAKIEAAKMEVAAGPVPIDPVVASVLEQFQDSVEAKGIRLYDEPLGEAIIGDELRLRQMLINLVGNAVKFTEHGEIRVWSRVTGDMVEILVTDTGCGIPPDAIDAVFERFNQVDPSATRRAGGTGLGLAVTKRFAELMGGEVRVTSVEGEGSTFSFTLPRAT